MNTVCTPGWQHVKKLGEIFNSCCETFSLSKIPQAHSAFIGFKRFQRRILFNGSVRLDPWYHLIANRQSEICKYKSQQTHNKQIYQQRHVEVCQFNANWAPLFRRWLWVTVKSHQLALHLSALTLIQFAFLKCRNMESTYTLTRHITVPPHSTKHSQ